MSTCPRCAPAPGDLTTWRAASPAGEVDLLGCNTCGGVFIDRQKLAAVCPTAAHLPDHVGEVALTGKPGAGIAFCPGCSNVPHQVELVGVRLDFCTSCHGVWLDASDYEESPFSEKKGVPPPNAPYRARPAELSGSDGLAACVYCNQRFPPQELAFWEHGRICRACMASRAMKRASRIARESERSWIDDFFDRLSR